MMYVIRKGVWGTSVPHQERGFRGRQPPDKKKIFIYCELRQQHSGLAPSEVNVCSVEGLVNSKGEVVATQFHFIGEREIQ